MELKSKGKLVNAPKIHEDPASRTGERLVQCMVSPDHTPDSIEPQRSPVVIQACLYYQTSIGRVRRIVLETKEVRNLTIARDEADRIRDMNKTMRPDITATIIL